MAKGGVSLLALVTLGLMLGTPSAEASETTGETRSKVVKLAQSFDQFHAKNRAYGPRGAYGYPLLIALCKVPIEVLVKRGVLTLWSTSGSSTA